MNDEPLPAGPDRDEMIGLIRETWPDAVVATIAAQRLRHGPSASGGRRPEIS